MLEGPKCPSLSLHVEAGLLTEAGKRSRRRCSRRSGDPIPEEGWERGPVPVSTIQAGHPARAVGAHRVSELLGL